MKRSRFLRQFSRDERATALIEFAISLPVLMFCAFVLFEFATFQLARIKVDRTAYMLANSITQLPISSKNAPVPDFVPYTYISDAALSAVLATTDDLVPRVGRGGVKVVASGISYIDHTYVHLTSPSLDYNSAAILWASAVTFGGVVPGSQSTVRAIGGNTAFPASLRMTKAVFTDQQTLDALAAYGGFSCDANPEHFVLVEVFFDYRPVFSTLFEGFELPVNFINRQTIVSRAYMQPRGADIEALDGNASFNEPTTTYMVTKARGFCD